MAIISQHLNNILGQRATPLWDGYVNMLKPLESILISPKHWVLEFLQDAEGASSKKISIRLGQDSLHILNNGKPFAKDDFDNICDILPINSSRAIEKVRSN